MSSASTQQSVAPSHVRHEVERSVPTNTAPRRWKARAGPYGHAPMPVRRAARAPQSAFVPMNASRPAKARIPIGDQRSLPLIGRLWREFVRTYIPWLLDANVASAVDAAANAVLAWLLDPEVNKGFRERGRHLV